MRRIVTAAAIWNALPIQQALETAASGPDLDENICSDSRLLAPGVTGLESLLVQARTPHWINVAGRGSPTRAVLCTEPEFRAREDEHAEAADNLSVCPLASMVVDRLRWSYCHLKINLHPGATAVAEALRRLDWSGVTLHDFVIDVPLFKFPDGFALDSPELRTNEWIAHVLPSIKDCLLLSTTILGCHAVARRLDAPRVRGTVEKWRWALLGLSMQDPFPLLTREFLVRYFPDSSSDKVPLSRQRTQSKNALVDLLEQTKNTHQVSKVEKVFSEPFTRF
ncbi:hypothetical protein ACSDQ9_08285 [Aestuariimicrobium soli]|uniref:hypothetical protein n=1 Tax=Aestuariimicrobium soli TaxID=2035834 RepID=UPI003EBBFE93